MLQVAEMQEQTNKKIEDFRAQAQKYVTDARQQSVQQAERDLKGQYRLRVILVLSIRTPWIGWDSPACFETDADTYLLI